MAKVLLVGFGKREQKKLASYFRTVDVFCDVAANVEGALTSIPKDPPTVVIADRPTRFEQIHSLRDVLRQSAPATPLVLALPDARADLAISAMNAGAYDCLARPLERADVLAAAKRAAMRSGRTLCVPKIQPRPRRAGLVGSAVAGFVAMTLFLVASTRAIPATTLDLGSATLSGVQWSGRRLWVGNWYESTVTSFQVGKSIFGRTRRLLMEETFKLPDVQPILVCDTPNAFYTVGFDLMIRSHRAAPGLPISQTEKAPGSEPTGLAWDGKSLWSCDGASGLLYRHAADLSVAEAVPSILPHPAGLAGEKNALWIVGGKPLKVARLERRGDGYVWKGPYLATDLLAEGVEPTGVAAGHGRLWAVSGGDPRMSSVPLKKFTGTPDIWMKAGAH